MDPYQRQRSHTIATNITNIQRRRTESNKFSDTLSRDINTRNRTSLPPGSPPPLNQPGGKSWMKLFSGHHHTKQTSLTSSNNSLEFDLSYITPRLIVMTTPRNNMCDISSRSTFELIDNVLNTKHPNSYMIYRLDQSFNDDLSYGKEFFNNRVVDLPLFDESQSPRLIVLLWFCQKLTSYLLESPSNVVILHSTNETNHIGFGACSLIAYHQIFSKVEQIVSYYQSKRCSQIYLTMSKKRYIQYLCDLSFGLLDPPHFNQLTLKSIELSPIPLVNRQKTGCRPFVDIYDQEHKKIFSTYQDTSKLKFYSENDNHCSIPINLPFNGDLTVHLTHAAIGHLRQTHEGGIRICELTINSNFSTVNQRDLSYLRNELDGIDYNEKNPTLFRLTIQITNPQKSPVNTKDSFNEQLEKTFRQPLTLFTNDQEFQKIINDYEKQIEEETDDSNDKNEILSSVIRRTRKSKDEPTSPISISSPSPQNQFSQTLPLSAPTSSGELFSDSQNNPFKQPDETNQQPTISVEQQNQNENQNEQTNDVDLLGLDDNNFLPKNQSTIQEQQISSKPNLLDEDIFNLDQTVLEINPTPFIFPSPVVETTKTTTTTTATIPKTEEKSSIPIPTSPTINTPNYKVNVNLPTNKNSSSLPQSNSVGQNLSRKSSINADSYFDEFITFNKGTKLQSETSAPTTIGLARKASLAKDVDPTVLKIREWTEGKTRNLRALLCSLSSITWPECKWSGCQMHELVTVEQVKKAYRKAVLHIHPDKLRGDPNEALAKLIFVELNEAWAQFEKESNEK